MSREDFVSDRLVSLTERFRQNAAERQNNAGSANAPAAPAALLDTPALPVRRELPEKAIEIERIRRDFAGRLCRDSAAAAERCEILRGELRKYEAYCEVLNGIVRRFDDLGGVSEDNLPMHARELEAMRRDYFIASGRMSAYEKESAVSAGSSRGIPDRMPFREALIRTVPLGIFLLLSALIVGAAVLIALL